MQHNITTYNSQQDRDVERIQGILLERDRSMISGDCLMQSRPEDLIRPSQSHNQHRLHTYILTQHRSTIHFYSFKIDYKITLKNLHLQDLQLFVLSFGLALPSYQPPCELLATRHHLCFLLAFLLVSLFLLASLLVPLYSCHELFLGYLTI